MSGDSVIFDLDGTLWDINPAVALARNQVLVRRGIPHPLFTAEDIRKTVGLPNDEVYRRALPGSPPELQDSIRQEVEELLVPLIDQGARLFPGVADGVPRLAATRPLFIVSNCAAGYIEKFFAWSKLGRYFQDHACYGATGLSKAENIRLVVKRHGLQNPVFVGDMKSDQEAARTAGLQYIHVDYGFGEPNLPCRRAGVTLI